MIGTVIKILRTQNKLSQKELGNLLHLSDTTISAYEMGKISPSFETIVKIFRLCGCDLCIKDKNNNIIDIEGFIKKNG